MANALLLPTGLLAHVPVRQQGYVIGALCIVLAAVGLAAVALALVGVRLLQVVVALVDIFFTK